MSIRNGQVSVWTKVIMCIPDAVHSLPRFPLASCHTNLPVGLSSWASCPVHVGARISPAYLLWSPATACLHRQSPHPTFSSDWPAVRGGGKGKPRLWPRLGSQPRRMIWLAGGSRLVGQPTRGEARAYAKHLGCRAYTFSHAGLNLFVPISGIFPLETPLPMTSGI